VVKYDGFGGREVVLNVLVTGSVAIDSVESPHGRAENVLGGSAVFFAFAARHYASVRVAGVVGGDFPGEHRRALETHNIDLAGLEIRRGSRTFRWSGRYEDVTSDATTLTVDVNVLGEAGPQLPAEYRDSEVVFLAATHPHHQLDVFSQLRHPRLVLCDTRNLWITEQRDALLEIIRKVSGVIINDAEAKQLTGQANLLTAAEEIRKLGPKFVVVKKGEHGSLLLSDDGPVAVPAYPTLRVQDPTGAGDSFAGGFLGYWASRNTDDSEALRNALIRGTVAASFAIEDFSIRRVQHLTRDEVNQRVDRFLGMLRFR